MKVTVQTKAPEPPPIESVTIVMSADDARMLRHIMFFNSTIPAQLDRINSGSSGVLVSHGKTELARLMGTLGGALNDALSAHS